MSRQSLSDQDRPLMAAAQRRARLKTGCLISLVLFVLILAAAIYFLGKPVRAAKSLEQQLNDQHQEASAFVPALDGAVPAARMESFLRIRRQVQPHCVSLGLIQDEAENLNQLEDDTESSGSIKLMSSLSSLRQLIGFGPRFLEFMNARNSALLEEKMGLGEYMYIYTLVYGPRVQAAVDALDASEIWPDEADKDAIPSERARREIGRMLRNQQAALAAAATPDSLWSASLAHQIEALDHDEIVAPWVRNRPPGVERSLAPYAAELDGLFCPSLVRIELTQKNKGLQIEG